MNETYVTLTGMVGSDIERKQLTDGTPLATFRLGAQTRKWDFRTKAFVQGETTWVTVTCWRGLAVNVGHSVVRRDRVVVHGRLRTPEWTDAEGGRHSRIDVEALAVGHDLVFGTSNFTRVSRVQSVQNPAQAEADDAGLALEQVTVPEDVSSLTRERVFGSTGPLERDDDEELDDYEDDELDEESPAELVHAGRG